ncbi:MAG TPA: hypothetical protein VK419_02225 [Bryobacteraceae bacterium]|nr:hypothetical protein [Bryobacteraceae bacterium]
MKAAMAIAILCAGGLSAPRAAAQTQAEVRGKKIIEDSIAALGGDAFLNMEDRIESGRAYSFYREQISGLSVANIYTRYITVAAGKSGEEIGQRERQSFGKDEDVSVLFTEKGGWELSWRGVKPMDQARIDRWRDTTLRNIFYILRQRRNEPGMIFEARGSDVFENQPVDIVDITDADNRVVTVYVHQDTKLPVRQIYRHYNSETKEQDDEVTLYSRYRDAGDGVEWPHQIRRERNGEKVYEIYAESVKINQGLTDQLFSVPAPGEKPEKPKRKK